MLGLRLDLRQMLLGLLLILQPVPLVAVMMHLVLRLLLCRCWELELVRLLSLLGCCRCECWDDVAVKKVRGQGSGER
jgi:hypothetical protein